MNRGAVADEFEPMRSGGAISPPLREHAVPFYLGLRAKSSRSLPSRLSIFLVNGLDDLHERGLVLDRVELHALRLEVVGGDLLLLRKELPLLDDHLLGGLSRSPAETPWAGR